MTNEQLEFFETEKIDKTYLKFVGFKDLGLWDVKRYYKKYNLQFSNAVFLSDILKPYQKSVSKEEMLKNKWQIISKINNKGELFLRDFEEINTYKGSLKIVPDNTIIYSKIGAKLGSIYFHEQGKAPFGVSLEYPAYTFNNNKVNGKFLQRLLRSNYFKELLGNKTSGISRARVKEEEFLSLQIPLPSLHEQEQIFNNYYDKINEANDLEKENEYIRKNLEQVLFENVKDETNKNKEDSFLNFVDYKDLRLWDVKNYKKTKLKTKFQLVKLDEILSIDKMDWVDIEDEKEYPILGVRAQGRGVYINRIAKGSELTMKKYQKSKANYLFYCKVRTVNGQWGVVYPEFENSYGSSNMQYLKIDERKINLRFFECLLTIKILTNEFDKNAIGADGRHFTLKTLLNQKIPLPSLHEQEKLIGNYFENIKQAQNLKNQAEMEFEKSVFGSKI